MLFARLRNDPLRALIWLEVCAVAAAYPLDVLTAAAGIVPRIALTAESFAAYSALFAIAAAAVFSLPHAPNRRFLTLGVAVVATALLGVLPQNGSEAGVLFTVLAIRLTFGFGPRGTAIAWFAIVAGVAAAGLAQFFAPHAHMSVQYLVSGMLYNVLIVTLVFGMIAIVWLYARKGAAAAASAERVRIALDLHDALGHSLTTLAVQCSCKTRQP